MEYVGHLKLNARRRSAEPEIINRSLVFVQRRGIGPANLLSVVDATGRVLGELDMDHSNLIYILRVVMELVYNSEGMITTPTICFGEGSRLRLILHLYAFSHQIPAIREVCRYFDVRLNEVPLDGTFYQYGMSEINAHPFSYQIITTVLCQPHIRETLGFLLYSEFNFENRPGWFHIHDSFSYIHPSGMIAEDPPPIFHGGILNNEEGRGHLLALLSLLAFHVVPIRPDFPTAIVQSSDYPNQPLPLPEVKPFFTTLVITDYPNVWLQAIEHNTRRLKVLYYMPWTEVPDFLDYDIVVTMYTTVRTMYSPQRNSHLFTTMFHRVVFYNAHTINGHEECLAPSLIRGAFRWVVTPEEIIPGSHLLGLFLVLLELDPLVDHAGAYGRMSHATIPWMPGYQGYFVQDLLDSISLRLPTTEA